MGSRRFRRSPPGPARWRGWRARSAARLRGRGPCPHPRGGGRLPTSPSMDSAFVRGRTGPGPQTGRVPGAGRRPNRGRCDVAARPTADHGGCVRIVTEWPAGTAERIAQVVPQRRHRHPGAAGGKPAPDAGPVHTGAARLSATRRTAFDSWARRVRERSTGVGRRERASRTRGPAAHAVADHGYRCRNLAALPSRMRRREREHSVIRHTRAVVAVSVRCRPEPADLTLRCHPSRPRVS